MTVPESIETWEPSDKRKFCPQVTSVWRSGKKGHVNVLVEWS